jgi:Thioredoxin like C-terminal domain
LHALGYQWHRARAAQDPDPAPGDDHGVDSDPDGSGEVREPRLYQLIRQKEPVQDRTFEIEFLDPGVEVFSFTFGQ